MFCPVVPDAPCLQRWWEAVYAALLNNVILGSLVIHPDSRFQRNPMTLNCHPTSSQTRWISAQTHSHMCTVPHVHTPTVDHCTFFEEFGTGVHVTIYMLTIWPFCNVTFSEPSRLRQSRAVPGVQCQMYDRELERAAAAKAKHWAWTASFTSPQHRAAESNKQQAESNNAAPRRASQWETCGC